MNLFFALRHLHRAIGESNVRYKWIDATIAAELAIKEFLIRKMPEIETLIMAVPSPPLSKLYGEVLKSFIGESSPEVSALNKGSERRNILIHRPREHAITEQEANEYINSVEIAIYHLLSFLERDDKTIKKLYTRMQQAKEELKSQHPPKKQ